jgi:hypothetical protein
VERSFASWISHNRRMSLGITRGYVRVVKRSRICCDESPHAEAIGSLMRLFHTVSEVKFCELRLSGVLGSWTSGVGCSRKSTPCIAEVHKPHTTVDLAFLLCTHKRKGASVGREVGLGSYPP